MKAQWAVLFLALAALEFFLLAQRSGLQLAAALTLVCIGTVGLVLTHRTSKQLADPRLSRLGYVYIAKLVLVIAVLHAGWIPMLDPAAPAFGYDPQRFYFEAWDLARSGFSIWALPSLNYTGILYYLGGIFNVAGHNPVTPALINTFLTLVATLALVRMGYRIKPARSRSDWTLGLAMIVPEVIWFDALTSREALCLGLLTLSVLWFAEYFLDTPGTSSGLRRVALALLALLSLGIIRPSALVPAITSIAILGLVYRSKLWHRPLPLLLAAGGVAFLIVLVPAFVAERLSSSRFELRSIIDLASQIEVAHGEQFVYSSRSVGLLLQTDSPVKALFLAPARVLAYLASPLPQNPVDLAGLLRSDWAAFQLLLTSLSSALYLALFPLIVASLLTAATSPATRNWFVFQLPFWVLIVSIALGNQAIIERYRVMAVPFLWGCIWLGSFAEKRKAVGLYAVWCAVVAGGFAAYLGYKYIG